MEPVQAFLSAHSAIIGAGLLIALFIAFAMERWPPVIIAVVAAVLMLALGVLSPERLLRVFSNPAPITIGAMFVITGALTRTGALDAVAAFVMERARRRPKIALAELGLGTVLASGFMNNTPVVIVLIPIMKRLAKSIGIAATRLLIPLSYLSIMGGSLTLIGTSTNLLVDGVAQREGLGAFGIFEITGVGLVGLVAGVLILALLGPFLLPSRPDEGEEADEAYESTQFLSELELPSDSDWLGREIGETPLEKRAGVRVLGVKRGSLLQRKDIDAWELKAGDRLIVAATPAELASLAETSGVRVGLTGVGGGVATSGPERPDDLRLVEAAISPSHAAIGHRLSDIPFLSRLRVRVLGIARPRHLAGPDLATARIRVGDRLLIAAGPDALQAMRSNVGLMDVGESEARAYRRTKAPIAILTLLGIVVGAALFDLPIEALAIVGVAVVLVSRCLEPDEAWGAIDGNTLILIFGMLAFGAGLQAAGTVNLIVGALTPHLMSASPLMLLIGVYALTSLLTESVTNNAVAVIMTPIVIGIGEAMSVDPRELIVAVMFGASASFATPIGYQTNTLVYGAANYRFADFIKIGLPMNIGVGIAVCIAIQTFF